ncbi:diguanylate cyclase [Xanthomonas sp. NCPPB 2654]|uniref:tetratricopeptide repeat-containing diguanylate cyclase n=1 Tax=unclassified Xanthomonas TaxID=2643310 RepID=UPI0021E06EEF|nr:MULTISPECIES: tetratricopeptide repeat-containing diguanylate cyclase [unclassified Xanthomonas]MDL5364598.1 diguanylate cyclase [Xanthomonas sp. NCPPB 2654]UYC21916.1 diguanylate cyclase [Xanthomonas sp. CFBP 8443]
MRSRFGWQPLGALLWWVVLGLPAAAVAAPCTQALSACVAELREQDPAAALQLGEPAWDAGGDARDRTALGLELVDAASAANRPERIVAIGSVLRQQTDLSPQQRLRLLKRLNGAMWQTRDAARIAELEAEMTRFERLLPDEPSLAELWRQLAASYYKMGAQDDALRVARLALSKVRKHPDLVDYNANQIVFVVSAQQGRLPDAIAALLEVERVGKALGKPADPALLHNATGVFVYAHEWPKAIDYGQRALAAYDANPRKGLARADVLNNLGSAYEGADQLQRAEALYRQALASARTAGDASLSGPLNNLANVLRRLHRPREALPLLREAAALIDAGSNGEHGDYGEAAIVYSNIGLTLVDLGQREAAATEFERSRALFAQSDNVPRRLELYPRMIDNLDALGRTREALALMREYKTVNDEAVNVESKTRIAELESAVDLARKNTELAAVGRARAAEQAAYAQLQAREQRQRAMVYGLLAAVLALVAFVAWKVREARARRRINAELARKNDEIQAQHRELEQLTAVIRRQSEEDALTGLRNRRYVTGWLQARDTPAPAQEREPLLVAVLDIDHFKRVNDLHGHEGGDHALMHLSDILRECARGSDVIARWGGEEFLWICPGGTLADAPVLFRRLRERLHAEPLVRPTGTVALTVSMGVSLFPAQPGGDWSLSLRIADAALYRAKHGGRDRWVALTLSDAAPALAEAGPDLPLEMLQAQGLLLQSGGAVEQPAAATERTDD